MQFGLLVKYPNWIYSGSRSIHSADSEELTRRNEGEEHRGDQTAAASWWVDELLELLYEWIKLKCQFRRRRRWISGQELDWRVQMHKSVGIGPTHRDGIWIRCKAGRSEQSTMWVVILNQWWMLNLHFKLLELSKHTFPLFSWKFHSLES